VSPGLILVLVATVLLVLAGAVAAGRAELTRRSLRTMFGPEYDRAVRDHGGRRTAVRELTRRRSAHRGLRPGPVTPVDRKLYSDAWDQAQGAFLDDPAAALSSAEQLLLRLLDLRGYPADDEAERIALLSVRHSAVLDAFRAARETSRQALKAPGAVSTEARRNALINYRELFDSLLAEPDAAVVAPRARSSEAILPP